MMNAKKRTRLIIIICLILIISATFFYFLKVKVEGAECIAKLKCIHSALIGYYDEHGQLPAYNKWYDLLLEHANQNGQIMVPDVFRCPTHTKKVRCGTYVINQKHCGRWAKSNPDTVLVFEGNSGWNQTGGIDQIRPRHHSGCYILFSNGDIKFIKKENFGSLNWGDYE